jgi:hypothetical protein
VNIQAVMLTMLLNTQPSVTCEHVGDLSHDVMTMVVEGYSKQTVQQYYDEIGLGEGLRFVIQKAYEAPTDPEEFRQFMMKGC